MGDLPYPPRMSRLRLTAATALVAALGPGVSSAAEDVARVTTFRCPAAAFEAFVDPGGAVEVLAYRFDNAHRALPTGAALAILDSAGGHAGRLCSATRTRPFRTTGLVGPHPRAVAGRVFCSSDPFVGWSHPPRYIGLQFRAVTDRKHHRVGSEMIVSVNATPAVRVRLTRSGGGLWYAFDRCLRNRAPSR
jgi:hypothetical protein